MTRSVRGRSASVAAGWDRVRVLGLLRVTLVLQINELDQSRLSASTAAGEVQAIRLRVRPRPSHRLAVIAIPL